MKIFSVSEGQEVLTKRKSRWVARKRLNRGRLAHYLDNGCISSRVQVDLADKADGLHLWHGHGELVRIELGDTVRRGEKVGLAPERETPTAQQEAFVCGIFGSPEALMRMRRFAEAASVERIAPFNARLCPVSVRRLRV